MSDSKKCRGGAALRPQPKTDKDTSNDFVGYEVLIDFIQKRKLHKLEGDIIEIGVFMGGGTAKLARFARKYGKRVYAVDIFDPGCDKTQDKSGVKMCEIYEAFLQGRSQLEVYQKTTQTIDKLIKKHGNEISEVHEIKDKHILLLTKKKASK